jgi:hypothetical protein
MGGSLAVTVESQVHFGRQAHVVALCLMMVLPPMACAAVTPLLLRRVWE